MTTPQYYLEPDFRISQRITFEEFDAVPRCLRCQKPLGDKLDKRKAVTVNWENWRFVDGHKPDAWPNHVRAVIESGYLGADCHRRMTKNGPDKSESVDKPD